MPSHKKSKAKIRSCALQATVSKQHNWPPMLLQKSKQCWPMTTHPLHERAYSQAQNAARFSVFLLLMHTSLFGRQVWDALGAETFFLKLMCVFVCVCLCMCVWVYVFVQVCGASVP
mmetsp:Transcript_143079/g.274838  ORF Transcript_143079/g.274838 Transcript_143079/m.274838 type:complete len:116 (-) Transcript_143079:168-515(-)